MVEERRPQNSVVSGRKAENVNSTCRFWREKNVITFHRSVYFCKGNMAQLTEPRNTRVFEVECVSAGRHFSRVPIIQVLAALVSSVSKEAIRIVDRLSHSITHKNSILALVVKATKRAVSRNSISKNSSTSMSKRAPEAEGPMEDIPLEKDSIKINGMDNLQLAMDDGDNKDRTKDELDAYGQPTIKPDRNQKTGRDLGVLDHSLEDRANCMSGWMLSYLTPLLKIGANKILDEDDVGVPSKEDRADAAYKAALAAWNEQEKKCAAIDADRQKAYEDKLQKCSTEEQRNKVKPPKQAEPSIASALVKSFGAWKVIYAIILYVISALLTFLPVLILNDLVKFFERGQSVAEYDGIWYKHPWVEVVGLGVLPVAITLLQTRHQVIMAHCAVYVRTAVSTLLYRKSLRISAAGRAKTSTGQVVNIMSNDTTQLQRFLQFAGMTMVAPIQIVLSLALIYQQVGNATWVGVGFMVFLAPINVMVFSVVSKMRRRVLKYSDLRVKMMNEILAGIRIIKFYAWVSQITFQSCFPRSFLISHSECCHFTHRNAPLAKK